MSTTQTPSIQVQILTVQLPICYIAKEAIKPVLQCYSLYTSQDSTFCPLVRHVLAEQTNMLITEDQSFSVVNRLVRVLPLLSEWHCILKPKMRTITMYTFRSRQQRVLPVRSDVQGQGRPHEPHPGEPPGGAPAAPLQRLRQEVPHGGQRPRPLRPDPRRGQVLRVSHGLRWHRGA